MNSPDRTTFIRVNFLFGLLYIFIIQGSVQVSLEAAATPVLEVYGTLNVSATPELLDPAEFGKSTTDFESVLYVSVDEWINPNPEVSISCQDSAITLECTTLISGGPDNGKYYGVLHLTKGSASSGAAGADAYLKTLQEYDTITFQYDATSIGLGIIEDTVILRNLASLNLEVKPWLLGNTHTATMAVTLVDDNQTVIDTASYTIEWKQLNDGQSNGSFQGVTGTYLDPDNGVDWVSVSSATAGVAEIGFQATATGTATLRATVLDPDPVSYKYSFASDTSPVRVIPSMINYSSIYQELNLDDNPNVLASGSVYYLSTWIKTTDTLVGYANFGVTQFSLDGTKADSFNFASSTGQLISHGINNGEWKRYGFKFTMGSGPNVTADLLKSLTVELFIVGSGTVRFDGVQLEKMNSESGSNQGGASAFTLFKTLRSPNNKKDRSGKRTFSQW